VSTALSGHGNPTVINYIEVIIFFETFMSMK
jgi:hypothetical protein